MRIGVLGGGQLGMMLAQAGRPLGYEFRFFDPSPTACARTEGELIVGHFDDTAALARFAQGLDVATYEFENVPVATVEHVARTLPVYPGPESLRVAQDRVLEKQAFERIGFGTAPFRAAGSEHELRDAVASVGAPGVLKARKGGYDGRSQVVIQSTDEAPQAWRAIGAVPSIYEGFISFRRELSLVGVRARDGATAFYPLVENHHEGGILRTTIAPASHVPEPLQREAQRGVAALMDHLAHVGVLTVEFFQIGGGAGGALLANEFAPRVHNSGHWTIEGAATSQFLSHVHAVVGDPLAAPEPVAPSIMVNLIGVAPPEALMRAVPHVHVHMYGKQPRPGRKIGHCTIIGAPPDELRAARAQLEAIIAHWEDGDPAPRWRGSPEP